MSTIHTPHRTVTVTDYDLVSVSKASLRFAEGDFSMSTHEYTAAAIVCGRLEDIGEDFRRSIIKMGPAWAHAVIEILFDHGAREMALRADDPNCPVGDQRIFNR